jgi:hypothetical protein
LRLGWSQTAGVGAGIAVDDDAGADLRYRGRDPTHDRRTKMTTILRPFALALALSSCAPAPPAPEIAWSKNVPQTPEAQQAFQAQARKDQFDCTMLARNSAVQRPSKYQSWFDAPVADESTQRQAIFRECMLAQGYTQTAR